MLFAKSPMQMRREAEERESPKSSRKPRPPKPAKVDPEKQPVLDRDNWLGYLRTGEIEASQS